MTFDKWFEEYNKSFGLPPTYEVAKAAWCAAISSTTEPSKPLTEEEISKLFPFKGYAYVGPEDC